MACATVFIYLFRRCLSRKTCRDGTFHISLVPGTVALEKGTQPWHHARHSSTGWKPHQRWQGWGEEDPQILADNDALVCLSQKTFMEENERLWAGAFLAVFLI